MSRSTFSKHRLRYPAHYPVAISKGKGAYVWDNNNRRYLDWVQGLGGAGVFGHAPLRERIDGLVYHLPHILESEVTDLLCGVLPDYAEDVRFCLNGTDATAGAIRLARAVTDRNVIIMFDGAYHGESSADWAIAAKSPARGVPTSTEIPVLATWNDMDSVRKRFDHDVAAVIFEVGGEAPTPEFARGLREVCDEYGALLIADEVVTGFRLALGGACELYGIEPDLACFGKALGSGVPIAALVGKHEYMREFDLLYTNSPVFMSFTHAGNTLSLKAAKRTLTALRDRHAISLIQSSGSQLMERLSDLAQTARLQNVVSVSGQPARHGLRFVGANGVQPHEMIALYQQCMAERGILVGWTNCPTTEHGQKEIDRTIDAARDAFLSIELAVDAGDIHTELVGEVPTPLYVRPT